MYEIALSVSACLRAGTRVDVAWAVQTHGFSQRDPNEALAITPGGGRIGQVLSGAANEQLAEIAQRGSARAVSVTVAEFEAQLAGLACGGSARCLVVPATAFPAQLWGRLHDRDPVCLVAQLDPDGAVNAVNLYDRDTVGEAGEEAARLFARGVSDSLVRHDSVVTVLWPVPKLVVVGGGAVAEALSANAELLGWRAQVVTEVGVATGVIAGLAVLDNIVVTAHDLDLAGAALQAALSSGVGYLGALGSRRTQEARAEWLAYRGVTDLSRVHGPAGLDIGSRTPPEIAVAILAEALAVRSGRAATSLRDSSGAVR